MSNRPMIQVLQRSSLHSLLFVTSRMLSRSGFGEVQILDRREPRQKSRYGGHELVCEGTFGGLPTKVIVKVINDSVRLRMLDELAGAVMRTHADFGLIVSPHHVTASALRYQESYRSAHLHLIDGTALAERLTHLGIGVRRSGQLDYQFFWKLEELARMNPFVREEAL